MKRLILILILLGSTLTSPSWLAGQTPERRHSVFFEALGSGGLGSLNYETSLLRGNTTELALRLGLSFAPIDANNGTAIVLPVLVHLNIGQRAHKLELGLGQSFSITTRGSFFILAPATLGYRFQPRDKPLFFRIAYTPLISYLLDLQWQHWAGLSIGYTFGRKRP